MRIPLWSVICAAAAAVTAVATAYLIGQNQSGDDVQQLMQEVESLRQNELEAAVVKRASQQMEDIAYQQKSISDQQRERAEEQSRLALSMRDRAEQESRAARKAQQQALEALSEAELQRTKAMELQLIAEEQRDQATLAQSISDTLSYRNLSRTLGAAAITHYEAHDTEVSQLLAYASWYYANRYNGNTYQNSTFEALTTTTNSIHRYFNRNWRSQIEDVTPYDGNSVIAVTAYGEILKCDEQGIKTLFHDKDACDFRWVLVIDKNIYALNYHGSLYRLTPQGRRNVYSLSGDHYFCMVQADDHSLLLCSTNRLCWFDLTSNTISAQIELEQQSVTGLAQRGSQTLVFFDNGECSEFDRRGVLTPQRRLKMSSEVSASFYDSQQHCLCLGLDSGDIVLVNDQDSICFTLSEHNSSVTDIKIQGQVLISTSFDKTARVWNLDRLRNRDGYNFSEVFNPRSGSTLSKKSNRTAEWLIPAEYDFDKWPLAIAVIGDQAWIATSNGAIWQVCHSVPQMADKLRKSLKRDLTEDEWKQYIGADFPYIQFTSN